MFYIVFNSLQERTKYIDKFKRNGVIAVFHYLSLHKSPFYNDKYEGEHLCMSDFYSDNLVRLPLFYDLTDAEIDYICDLIKDE